MIESDETVRQLAEALRDAAAKLELESSSITSPSPHAITARSTDGRLLRLDVSSYAGCELSR